MLELSVGFQMRSKAPEVVFCVPSLIKTDLLGSVRLAWSLDPRITGRTSAVLLSMRFTPEAGIGQAI